MTGDSRPRLSRSFLLSAISSGSAILMLLLQSKAAHVLSEDDFGVMHFGLVLAVIGETLMDLGLHQATIRAIAQSRSQASRLFNNSLPLKALTGLGMLALLGAYVALTQSEIPAIRNIYFIFLLSAVLRSYVLTTRGVLMGLEHFGRDTAIVVIDRLLLLAAGFVVLDNGYGVEGLAWTFVVVRIGIVIFAIAMVGRAVGAPTAEFDLRLWRTLQRTALPIGAFLIVLNVYSYIDTVMLNKMTTDAEVGLYGAAYRIYEGLGYLPAILSAVLTPRLSALWTTSAADYRRLAWRGFWGAAGLAAAVAGPVLLIARPIMQIVFNSDLTADYGEATLALQILVAGLVFLFPIWILQAVAVSSHREVLLLRTASIGAAFNIVLNIWLIPAYGRNGAAAATLAAECLTLVLLIAGLRGVLTATPPAARNSA